MTRRITNTSVVHYIKQQCLCLTHILCTTDIEPCSGCSAWTYLETIEEGTVRVYTNQQYRLYRAALSGHGTQMLAYNQQLEPQVVDEQQLFPWLTTSRTKQEYRSLKEYLDEPARDRFLVVTATWCGPCRNLKTRLNWVQGVEGCQTYDSNGLSVLCLSISDQELSPADMKSILPNVIESYPTVLRQQRDGTWQKAETTDLAASQ